MTDKVDTSNKPTYSVKSFGTFTVSSKPREEYFATASSFIDSSLPTAKSLTITTDKNDINGSNNPIIENNLAFNTETTDNTSLSSDSSNIVINASFPTNTSKNQFSSIENMSSKSLTEDPPNKDKGIEITVTNDFKSDAEIVTSNGTYYLDKEIAKNADIDLKVICENLFTPNISFKGIDYTITVKDPFIERIQNYLNSLEIKSNSLSEAKVQTGDLKAKENISKKTEELELEKKSKLKEIVNKIKDSVLESKIAIDTKAIFEEQTAKMKAIIELYFESIKEILEPPTEVDDKESKTFIFKDEDDDSKEYSYILNDRRPKTNKQTVNYSLVNKTDVQSKISSSSKFVTVPPEIYDPKI